MCIRDRIKINQKTFIETIARRFDVSTTARYTATAGAKLGPRMEGESSGTWPYREAIGALLWLAGWSRLEIATAVRVVARHSNDPTERHWQAVLQIIIYLVGTKDLSLTFEREPESDLDLSVYTDSNFAEKADDRRSVSGVLVCLVTQRFAVLVPRRRQHRFQPPRQSTERLEMELRNLYSQSQ